MLPKGRIDELSLHGGRNVLYPSPSLIPPLPNLLAPTSFRCLSQVIIFYSMLPNGEMDELSLHGGCDVLDANQTKYSANFWLVSAHASLPTDPKDTSSNFDLYANAQRLLPSPMTASPPYLNVLDKILGQLLAGKRTAIARPEEALPLEA
jgi:hypothetical protein